MKLLYLNGADIEGGAARAATRLLQGVHAQGGDARLYVQRKYGDDPLVDGPRSRLGKVFGRVRPTIEQLICGINPGKINGPFCAAFLPDRLPAQIAAMAPDIVHLHWVARMMRLETLCRFTMPIVWTMHDSWAFTGGCYLPGDCTRYRESCGSCPALGSEQENDLSRRIWMRKQKAWHHLNLTIIAPSHWMAACARTSSLFRNSRIEVIPNGLDVKRFKPLDQHSARDILSLPQNRKLILFGAKGGMSDRNKGFHLLVEALQALAADIKSRDSMELLIFGSTEPASPPNLGFKTHYLGWQNDDTKLAALYTAADVFVLPSLHESLGYTAMEAMACGTPCVAFNQGGVPDLIDHQQNGYLANPYQPADLAHGIVWVLEDKVRWNKLADCARNKIIESFALEKIAERHMTLYRGILRHE
ncbi:MAG: glycosyltransferase family 4 protein [Desulfuromonadaceae bacterium]|nr:glycosyltransferase family 4 protein [Desulfuromonadaceae bacterium]